MTNDIKKRLSLNIHKKDTSKFIQNEAGNYLTTLEREYHFIRRVTLL